MAPLLCNTDKVDSFATFPDSIEVGDTIKGMLSKMSIAGSYRSRTRPSLWVLSSKSIGSVLSAFHSGFGRLQYRQRNGLDQDEEEEEGQPSGSRKRRARATTTPAETIGVPRVSAEPIVSEVFLWFGQISGHLLSSHSSVVSPTLSRICQASLYPFTPTLPSVMIGTSRPASLCFSTKRTEVRSWYCG